MPKWPNIPIIIHIACKKQLTHFGLRVLTNFGLKVLEQFDTKNHKQKIGNNGKYFLNYANFSCIIFCAELSRNSNLCTICLLPKVLTTGPSQFCVTNYPQLIYFCLSIYYSYYPNFTVKFKLQKAARMCQYYLLLCLNLTCEKTKNVPRPPPYLSPA